jgi:predicted nucleic acid-binding protein
LKKEKKEKKRVKEKKKEEDARKFCENDSFVLLTFTFMILNQTYFTVKLKIAFSIINKNDFQQK